MKQLEPRETKSIVFSHRDDILFVDCYQSMIPDNTNYFTSKSIPELTNVWLLGYTRRPLYHTRIVVTKPIDFTYVDRYYSAKEMKNGVIFTYKNKAPVVHSSPEKLIYYIELYSLETKKDAITAIIEQSKALVGKRAMVICHCHRHFVHDTITIEEKTMAFVVDATNLKADSQITQRQINQSKACLMAVTFEYTLDPETANHNEKSHAAFEVTHPKPIEGGIGRDETFHYLCDAYTNQFCELSYTDRILNLEYKFIARKRQKVE